MHKLNHRMDPVTYPIDASDLASLVTIDEAELDQLLDDELHAQYRPVMSIAITKWVAETQRAMTEGEHPPFRESTQSCTCRCYKKDVFY